MLLHSGLLNGMCIISFMMQPSWACDRRTASGQEMTKRSRHRKEKALNQSENQLFLGITLNVKQITLKRRLSLPMSQECFVIPHDVRDHGIVNPCQNKRQSNRWPCTWLCTHPASSDPPLHPDSSDIRRHHLGSGWGELGCRTAS